MIVGYYPNWNYRREGITVSNVSISCHNKFLLVKDASFDTNNIDPTLYTHLIYAYAALNKKTFCLKSTNEWIDIKDEGYKQFTDLKTRNPQLKLMISLGEWTDSTKNKTTKYFQLVSSPRNIDTFVKSALEFLEKYNFDGLDLHWKYPNTEEDRTGFTNLIVALHNALKPYGYLLSAAVPPTASAINAGNNYCQKMLI
jgi:chitinase